MPVMVAAHACRGELAQLWDLYLTPLGYSQMLQRHSSMCTNAGFLAFPPTEVLHQEL